ncbi:hypothetical protein GW17_00017576 [Ensete ventricosum]|nr:hypothetical protein GW17_00017576 [Ensete ventricosum]
MGTAYTGWYVQFHQQTNTWTVRYRAVPPPIGAISADNGRFRPSPAAVGRRRKVSQHGEKERGDYTDRPLPGGTAKIGRRRSIKGENDCRRSIEEEKGKRKKKKRKRRKKKRRRGEEEIPRLCTLVAHWSLARPHRPRGEAERLPHGERDRGDRYHASPRVGTRRHLVFQRGDEAPPRLPAGERGDASSLRKEMEQRGEGSLGFTQSTAPLLVVFATAVHPSGSQSGRLSAAISKIHHHGCSDLISPGSPCALLLELYLVSLTSCVVCHQPRTLELKGSLREAGLSLTCWTPVLLAIRATGFVAASGCWQSKIRQSIIFLVFFLLWRSQPI